MRRPGKERKIGLSLGGGGVLGAAHIGVLKALEELGVPIGCIAGTSIGALIAALYAFGKSCEDIEKMAAEMRWLDVSKLTLSRFGLLSNKKLGKLIKENIGDVTFDQARIPIAVVATDISTGERVVLDEGSVAAAVMASACIPGVFIPVEIGGRFLVDGGVVENVPITPLEKMGADFIIGVDLHAKRSYRKPRNIVEVLLHAFDFTFVTATRLRARKADVLVEPDLSSFNMIDMHQVADLVQKGYAEAKTVMQESGVVKEKKRR